MALIEVKKVSVIYNKGLTNESNAVLDINLEIYPEEYVMIFGPSGCGKSTLLNLIAGLENPTEGDIIIDGQNISEMDYAQMSRFHCTKIGMIFQAYNLLSSLTVKDNIILPQVFLGNHDFKERNNRADVLLKKFGIYEHANKIPTELSGGQQQRIGIARSLINDQPIILADEPVGNLDSKSAANVLDIIKELNEKNKKTIVMVTHNPEYLEYAHRIFYMKDGRMTHVVVNKKSKHLKKDVTQKEKEFDLLARSFPGLSEAQLHTLMIPFKAKIMSEYLLTSLNTDQIQRIEEFIKKRMSGKFSKYEFRMMLDRSFEKGGIGLDERTAIQYSSETEKIIQGAGLLQKNLKDKAESLNLEESVLKAKLISRYLIRSYIGNISEQQKNRLEHLVDMRFKNEIEAETFDKVLDMPSSEGGVGLDKRVTKKITRDLEIILLVKFGTSTDIK
ncbi:ABC transporter ATP-binding protein [Patescibacteria group bacterium]|nr:ABC transporter ATP-binding protein [Patescibacteria group bacterium]